MFFHYSYGLEDWTPATRFTYNLINPIVRSTVQVNNSLIIYFNMKKSHPLISSI